MARVQQVIITGATSGIGRATAGRFARAGAAILAVGRDRTALTAVAGEIEAAGGRAAVLDADITAAGSPDAIVDAATRQLGGITTLVNAAGIIASGTV